MEKKEIKKQIGSFAEFCKQKGQTSKSRQVRESSEVSIEVPFWDEAIEWIMSELRGSCGTIDGKIDWKRLVEMITDKFEVMGIFKPADTEGRITQHIKDRLYSTYFQGSFLFGDERDSSGKEAKSLILSQMAEAVLALVEIEAGIIEVKDPEDRKPVASVCLDSLSSDECCDPFERFTVMGFDDYNSMVKESVEKISLQQDSKAVEYCLDRIEKDCGSTCYDDVVKFAEKKKLSVEDYLSVMADEYMKTVTIELDGTRLKATGNEKVLLNQVRKLYVYLLTGKLTDVIKNQTVER